MNLQQERIATMCDTLGLPFVARSYAASVQAAANPIPRNNRFCFFICTPLPIESKNEPFN